MHFFLAFCALHRSLECCQVIGSVARQGLIRVAESPFTVEKMAEPHFYRICVNSYQSSMGGCSEVASVCMESSEFKRGTLCFQASLLFPKSFSQAVTLPSSDLIIIVYIGT